MNWLNTKPGRSCAYFARQQSCFHAKVSPAKLPGQGRKLGLAVCSSPIVPVQRRRDRLSPDGTWVSPRVGNQPLTLRHGLQPAACFFTARAETAVDS